MSERKLAELSEVDLLFLRAEQEDAHDRAVEDVERGGAKVRAVWREKARRLKLIADSYDAGITVGEAERIYMLASEADGLFGRIPSLDEPIIAKLRTFTERNPDAD